jgi:hypothetical protein
MPKSNRKPAQKGPNNMRSRRASKVAKFDSLGFPGTEAPLEDMGLDNPVGSNDYYDRWTTESLPQTGRSKALDDDQQPRGSGAPETTLPGPPLKTPMDASDVSRPRIREGREASTQLRLAAKDLAAFDPALARRLLVAATEVEKLPFDIYSTAGLELSGDDDANDDGQDKLNVSHGGEHGRLQLYGTDPARSEQLPRSDTRRSSRRARAASRWVAATSRAADNQGLKQVNWKNTMALVDEALQGRYDASAVARILHADYTRTLDLLKQGTNKSQDQQAAPQSPINASVIKRTALNVTAQYKNALNALRRARKQGDKPITPEPVVGPIKDSEGPGADGAGGFADRSKAPLQEIMTAEDVDRPKIRDNPEASRRSSRRASVKVSTWETLKASLKTAANVGGQWNEGQYEVKARDYGQAVELTADVEDREGVPHTAGSITLSLIHDSRQGRYASIEVNDTITGNSTEELTLNPSNTPKYASQLIQKTTKAAKALLNQV